MALPLDRCLLPLQPVSTFQFALQQLMPDTMPVTSGHAMDKPSMPLAAAFVVCSPSNPRIPTSQSIKERTPWTKQIVNLRHTCSMEVQVVDICSTSRINHPLSGSINGSERLLLLAEELDGGYEGGDKNACPVILINCAGVFQWWPPTSMDQGGLPFPCEIRAVSRLVLLSQAEIFPGVLEHVLEWCMW